MNIATMECIWGSNRILANWYDVCNFVGVNANDYGSRLWYQRIEDGWCPEDAVHALGMLLNREGYTANAERARKVSIWMLQGGKEVRQCEP